MTNINFKKLHEEGKANRDTLNDLIDEWHTGMYRETLHEFLGFENLEEYSSVIRSSF